MQFYINGKDKSVVSIFSSNSQYKKLISQNVELILYEFYLPLFHLQDRKPSGMSWQEQDRLVLTTTSSHYSLRCHCIALDRCLLFCPPYLYQFNLENANASLQKVQLLH